MDEAKIISRPWRIGSITKLRPPYNIIPMVTRALDNLSDGRGGVFPSASVWFSMSVGQAEAAGSRVLAEARRHPAALKAEHTN